MRLLRLLQLDGTVLAASYKFRGEAISIAANSLGETPQFHRQVFLMAAENASLMREVAAEDLDLESQYSSPRSSLDTIACIGDLDDLDWTSPKDPDNPLNWSERQKWTHILLVASLAFSV